MSGEPGTLQAKISTTVVTFVFIVFQNNACSVTKCLFLMII